MVRKVKKNRRIKGLDGIRTIALIGVLLYHTFPKAVPGGFFGVILFFVVSGYLAAVSGMASLEKNEFSVISYYKKRLIRLFPELIIVMFCTIGVMTMAAPEKMANTQSEVLSVVLGYNNFWQIRMNADYFAQLAKSSPFTHLWYIAVLIQFELIWPWLLSGYDRVRQKCGKGKALLAAAAVTLLSFLIMPVSAVVFGENSLTNIYYNTFTRIFSIFAGVLLGLLHSEKIHILSMHLRIPAAAGTLLAVYTGILIYLYLHASGTAMQVYTYGMALVTIIACRMIEIVSIRKNGTGRWMDNILCAGISRYSYEIYLWQYPVLMIAGILGFSSSWYHYLLQIAVILILSIWLYTFNNILQRKLAS